MCRQTYPLNHAKKEAIMRKIFVYSVVALGIAGCASAPTSPRVSVMPTPGKPFEVFADEDKICRHFAEQSLGAEPNSSASKSFIGSAALGTAIGAAAGALSSNGRGGGGAAGGLVGGSLIGVGESNAAQRDEQHRYDIAYQQCMYAKGNQIPGYAMQAQPKYAPPPPPTGEIVAPAH
jgi:hypothetical protein